MLVDLAKLLIAKNAINETTEVGITYQSKGIGHESVIVTGNFVIKKIIQSEEDVHFIGADTVAGKRVKFACNTIYEIDGMEPDRFARVYGITLNGEKVQRARKRGRKTRFDNICRILERMWDDGSLTFNGKLAIKDEEENYEGDVFIEAIDFDQEFTTLDVITDNEEQELLTVKPTSILFINGIDIEKYLDELKNQDDEEKERRENEKTEKRTVREIKKMSKNFLDDPTVIKTLWDDGVINGDTVLTLASGIEACVMSISADVVNVFTDEGRCESILPKDIITISGVNIEEFIHERLEQLSGESNQSG